MFPNDFFFLPTKPEYMLRLWRIPSFVKFRGLALGCISSWFMHAHSGLGNWGDEMRKIIVVFRELTKVFLLINYQRTSDKLRKPQKVDFCGWQ